MAAITHRLRCEMLEARRLMASDLSDTLNVNLESATVDGLRAAEVVLKYDPSVLDIEASDIKPGNVWQGQASLFSHVDEAEGQVKLFIFSTNEVSSQRGELVELQFDVLDQLARDTSAVTLSQLRLNEGAIDVDAQLIVGEHEQAPTEVETIKACGPWQAGTQLNQAAPMIERKN